MYHWLKPEQQLASSVSWWYLGTCLRILVQSQAKNLAPCCVPHRGEASQTTAPGNALLHQAWILHLQQQNNISLFVPGEIEKSKWYAYAHSLLKPNNGKWKFTRDATKREKKKIPQFLWVYYYVREKYTKDTLVKKVL